MPHSSLLIGVQKPSYHSSVHAPLCGGSEGRKSYSARKSYLPRSLQQHTNLCHKTLLDHTIFHYFLLQLRSPFFTHQIFLLISHNTNIAYAKPLHHNITTIVSTTYNWFSHHVTISSYTTHHGKQGDPDRTSDHEQA